MRKAKEKIAHRMEIISSCINKRHICQMRCQVEGYFLFNLTFFFPPDLANLPLLASLYILIEI